MTQTGGEVINPLAEGILYTQAAAKGLDHRWLVELTSRPGAGVVLTGPNAVTAARILQGQYGYERPIALDAARMQVVIGR